MGKNIEKSKVSFFASTFSKIDDDYDLLLTFIFVTARYFERKIKEIRNFLFFTFVQRKKFLREKKNFQVTHPSCYWVELLKFFTIKFTHRDVDDAFISGHDNRRLQKAKGGLSKGELTGCTGERGGAAVGCCWLCCEFCRKDPWRDGIMDDSIPRDEGLLRLGTGVMLADGDGTFFFGYEV